MIKKIANYLLLLISMICLAYTLVSFGETNLYSSIYSFEYEMYTNPQSKEIANRKLEGIERNFELYNKVTGTCFLKTKPKITYKFYSVKGLHLLNNEKIDEASKCLLLSVSATPIQERWVNSKLACELLNNSQKEVVSKFLDKFKDHIFENELRKRHYTKMLHSVNSDSLNITKCFGHE